MLQNITTAMLSELTPAEQQRLREWWNPQHMKDGDWFYGTYGSNCRDVDVYILSPYKTDNGIYGASLHEYGAEPDPNALPLLSVGQCIELFKDKTGRLPEIKDYDHFKFITVGLGGMGYPAEELIRALWDTVKACLREAG
jgi:hypothetical protein